MNINKELKDLVTGAPFPIQFPTKQDVEEVQNKNKGKKLEDLKTDQFPNETVGTAILSCLVRYIARDKNDGFYTNMLCNLILDVQKKPREVELNNKIKKFLEVVLNESMRAVTNKTFFAEDGSKKEGERIIGLYPSWVIAQIMEEAGIIPSDLETSAEAIESEQPLNEIKK